MRRWLGRPFDERSAWIFYPKLVRTSRLMSAARIFSPKLVRASHLMSAQLGFLSEAGSHKPFDERSARIFVRGDPRTTKSPGNPARRDELLDPMPCDTFCCE